MYFSRFKGVEVDASVGLDYRRCILEPGGGRYVISIVADICSDAIDMLTEFLGRPSTSDAFLESIGVSGVRRV